MTLKSTIILYKIIFLVCFFATQSFADVKTTRSKPTDILINYEYYNPLIATRFTSSELPYRTQELSLFFDINILSNYNFRSDVPGEKRTESYKKNSSFSISAFFVLNRFAAGIKLDFNLFNAISERTILYTDGGVLKSYNIVEKRLNFDIHAWLGYRILDNLGVGLEIEYKTYYKTFNRDYLETPGSPEPTHSYWNIGEEKLIFGPSVTYKPLSFLRFTYSLKGVYKRRIEHFYFQAEGLVNLQNIIKIVFIPITDTLFITAESMFSFYLGKNYDNIPVATTWYKEQILNVLLTIDWWIVPSVFYIRGGGFWESILFKRSSARAFSKPHDGMYENMFGLIAGIGYKVHEKFMFSIDFIYKYHSYPKYAISSVQDIDWFSSFNTYQVYISTRYQF